MPNKLFLKFFVYRLISVLVIQTSFVPDEYWQSLEVAHSAVFGYGHLTWEFKEKIRNMVYPSIFIIAYKLLSIFNIDTVFMLVYLPRIIQATLSAAADCCLYKFCTSFGIPSRHVWSICLLDWFSFYCGSRTIINTFESNLVCYGLFILIKNHTVPTQIPRTQLAQFAVVVLLICFVRPTACLIWGPFCMLLWYHYSEKQSLFTTFFTAAVILGPSLMILDSFFYQSLTLTPWNFVNVNLLKGVSSFYGSHGILWYITQGLPVALGLYYVPFAMQICCTLKSIVCRQSGTSSVDGINVLLLSTILISLLVSSAVPHKEHRFLLPLVPLMKTLAIQQVGALSRGKKGVVFFWACIVSFVIPTAFFGLIHNRGTLTVMNHLAASDPPSSVLFLMPCHSTPLYSHLHLPIPVRFITCEPPLNENLTDESEIFYSNPKSWVSEYFSQQKSMLPSHIIMFDRLYDLISNDLWAHNYTLSTKFFHTFFPDERVSQYVHVYVRQK